MHKMRNSASCLTHYAFFGLTNSMRCDKTSLIPLQSVTEAILSVTLLTCCLQCWPQKGGLTAEMIHPENRRTGASLDYACREF